MAIKRIGDDDFEKSDKNQNKNQKNKQMSEKKQKISMLLNILIIVFLILAIFFVVKLIPELNSAKSSDAVFNEMAADSVSTNVGEMKYDKVEGAKKIDWDSYADSEVVAWFEMDDISYPVMQHSNNTYYLSRLPDGSYNSGGSLFLLAENNPLLTDMSSFIYGHNMASGRMFGKLKKYVSDEYKDKEFYVYLPDGTRHVYKFFAVESVPQTSKAYTWSFGSEESFVNWQKWILNRSLVNTGMSPTVDAKFMTLSTCNGYGGTKRRLIIVGKEDRVEKIQDEAFWYKKYVKKHKVKITKWKTKSDSINKNLESFQNKKREEFWKQIPEYKEREKSPLDTGYIPE